jgi:molybdate transport system substrate-binding protein
LLGQIREVSAVELNVLAAGAVEAVVRDVMGSFEKENGYTVKLTCAPVGALRDKIYSGEPADLAIVTPMIVEELLKRSLVRSGIRTHLGRVGGGLAVRKGAPRPAISTPEELKRRSCSRKKSTTPTQNPLRNLSILIVEGKNAPSRNQEMKKEE